MIPVGARITDWFPLSTILALSIMIWSSSEDWGPWKYGNSATMTLPILIIFYSFAKMFQLLISVQPPIIQLCIILLV